MAHQENTRETTTEDRPAQPASTNRAAPIDTQKDIQMSSSILESKATEADLDTSVAELAERVASTIVATGRALNMPHDVLIETVNRALAEANAPTSRLAREWAPVKHPYGLCQPSRCLVQPRIDQYGRAFGHVGYHRSDVVTVQAELADAIEVGVGVAQDVLGLNLDDAIVHMRAIDPDEEVDDVPWYVTLSADEAEALGNALVSRAERLRDITRRRAEEAAAAEAADKQQVRALVQRLWSDPSGRATLQQLFGGRGAEEGPTPAAQSSTTVSGENPSLTGAAGGTEAAPRG